MTGRSASPGQMPAPVAIELSAVTVNYSSHGAAVLSNVSLALPVGEAAAIVGRSGAGKTTLSLVAAGLLKPRVGEVRHFGVALPKAATNQPSRVQMVFQNPYAALNPRRTIRSWLQWILARRGAGQPQVLQECIALAGLPESCLDVLPGQLSGGECQRACIAASLAADGRGLILDEPVTMLDSIARDTIIRTLKRLRSKCGISYLLVTHDLDLAADLCQRIYVLDQGRIIESGDVASVLQNPKQDLTRQLVAASFGGNQFRHIL